MKIFSSKKKKNSRLKQVWTWCHFKTFLHQDALYHFSITSKATMYLQHTFSWDLQREYTYLPLMRRKWNFITQEERESVFLYYCLLYFNILFLFIFKLEIHIENFVDINYIFLFSIIWYPLWYFFCYILKFVLVHVFNDCIWMSDMWMFENHW